MRGRRLGVLLVVASTVAWAAAPGSGALAAPAARSVPAPSSADAGRPARDSVPARPLESTLPALDARAGSTKIATPGRVQQLPGQAGYAFDTGTSVSLATTVTVPTLQCQNVPLFERDTQPGLQISLEIGGQYAMVQVYCAPGGSPGSYQQYSSLNVLLAGIPYQATGYEGTGPGAHIELSETADSSGLTATIAAPSQNFTKTFDVNGAWGGSAFVGTLDYSESSNGGVPAYNPAQFASTTLNGSSLGSYLSGTPTPNFAQQNSVFGSTLQDESSPIGSGDAFSITNSNATLPTLLVSTARPGVERPTTGTATIVFTVALSFDSAVPVYVDYATQDDNAVAGTDYTPRSGTLAFSPGTSSRKVHVTVLAGPESGGELDFLLAPSNPSYVYVPPGGASVGRIFAGPVVLNVDPDVVPLDGGVPMTLTGAYFGAPAAADSVKFCAVATGTCLAAPGATVENGTTISLNAPDLTTIAPSGSTTFLADTIVTDVNSVSSPESSSDRVYVGCTRVVNQVDGSWAYSGCVTKTSATDNVTERTSSVDGVAVSASPKDQVDYSTGGANGAALSSQGNSTVSLVLDNALIRIFRGVLDSSLTQPMTFTVPPGTQIAGMVISGSLTITPTSPGTATGTVSVTLPAFFDDAAGTGAAVGTLSFTTTGRSHGHPGGLSNLSISVPSASFGNLLSVTGLQLTYSSQTGWSVSGSVTAGGGSDTSPISGSLTYTNNVLTAGALHVTNLDMLDLFKIDSLDLTYASGAWNGQASLAQDDGTGHLAVSLAIDANGTVTSGSVTLADGPINLFGAIPTDIFTLTYGNGAWTASGRSGSDASALISGKIEISGGEIQSAQLKVQKYPVADELQIYKSSMTYSLVNGQKTFSGELVFKLPLQKGQFQGIGGNFTIVNGQLGALGITLLGSVPVPFAEGVIISVFGATVGWIPPPAQLVGGDVKIGLGPVFDAGQLLSLEGKFTRDEPPIPLVSDYTYTGILSVFTQPLGSATIVQRDNGDTSITLQIGGDSGRLTVGPVTLTGTLIGSFTTTKFSIDGTGSIALTGAGHFDGTIHADQNGMAACDGKKKGFSWVWGQNPTLQPTGKCSTKGY